MERALLEALGGTCRSPVAALAEPLEDGGFHLRAEILLPDGTEIVRGEVTASAAEARVKAAALGRDLLSRASPPLRSAESRVGQGCVRRCRFRWASATLK